MCMCSLTPCPCLSCLLRGLLAADPGRSQWHSSTLIRIGWAQDLSGLWWRSTRRADTKPGAHILSSRQLPVILPPLDMSGCELMGSEASPQSPISPPASTVTSDVASQALESEQKGSTTPRGRARSSEEDGHRPAPAWPWVFPAKPLKLLGKWRHLKDKSKRNPFKVVLQNWSHSRKEVSLGPGHDTMTAAVHTGHCWNLGWRCCLLSPGKQLVLRPLLDSAVRVTLKKVFRKGGYYLFLHTGSPKTRGKWHTRLIGRCTWPVMGPLCDLRPGHKESQQDTWLRMQARLDNSTDVERITQFKDIPLQRDHKKHYLHGTMWRASLCRQPCKQVKKIIITGNHDRK